MVVSDMKSDYLHNSEEDPLSSEGVTHVNRS